MHRTIFIKCFFFINEQMNCNYSNLSFNYGVKQVLKHRNEEYVPSGSAQVAVLSGIAF